MAVSWFRCESPVWFDLCWYLIAWFWVLRFVFVVPLGRCCGFTCLPLVVLRFDALMFWIYGCLGFVQFIIWRFDALVCFGFGVFIA